MPSLNVQGGVSMLFAIKYHPRIGRTESESRRVRELLMKWKAPEGVDVRQHFHYVSGGGVLIVDAAEAQALYETMGPFKPMVEFEVEPVINILEAVAISADIEEWVKSVSGVPQA